MGSRRSYFLVPESGRDMDFGAAIATLELATGVEFDRSFFLNEFDSDGDLLATREVALNENLSQLVQATTSDRRGLEIECFNTELLMVCCFGSPHETQLMSVAISNKMLTRLPPSRFHHYEEAIARTASAAGAAFVVIVDDAPDDLCGRLVAVDDRWIVDLVTTNWPVDPASVLAIKETCKLPEMRNLQPTDREVAGFREYRETVFE